MTLTLPKRSSESEQNLHLAVRLPPAVLSSDCQESHRYGGVWVPKTLSGHQLDFPAGSVGHPEGPRRHVHRRRTRYRCQQSNVPGPTKDHPGEPPNPADPTQPTQPSEDRTVGSSQCGVCHLNLTTEAQNLTAEHDDLDRQLVPFGTAQPAQLKHPHKGQPQGGR